MQSQELISKCKARNASFSFAEHRGENGQLAMDVRATVDGIRLALSAHACIHHDDQAGAIEKIRCVLLAEALAALEAGAEHWMQRSHKKDFQPPCTLCRAGAFKRGDLGWEVAAFEPLL